MDNSVGTRSGEFSPQNLKIVLVLVQYSAKIYNTYIIALNQKSGPRKEKYYFQCCWASNVWYSNLSVDTLIPIVKLKPQYSFGRFIKIKKFKAPLNPPAIVLNDML